MTMVYIHDHTQYLKKSSKRRIVFGQSIKASTFFICLGILLVFSPISYLAFRISSVLPGPVILEAIFVLFPVLTPPMFGYILLESKNDGDSFIEFFKKRWAFKTKTNYVKENGEKYIYAIGMAPKRRIIEGATVFYSSVVEVPKEISNLSGYIDGEPDNADLKVNDGIVLDRRD